MGLLNKAGKVAVALGVSGLAILAGIKMSDDRYVDGIWQYLEVQPKGERVFTEEMVADLPDPAKRFFLHSIRPGMRIPSKFHWGYSGELKPGKELPWLSLKAEQILVKDVGFMWKARAGKGPLQVTAADHYLEGEGRMRISLFGLIPIINATDADISRSALGRLVVENISIPGAFLPSDNVQIEGIDQDRFQVTVSLQGETIPITITVDEEGRAKEFTMQRWGDQTDDGSYRYIPYGGTISGEQTFEGYTIPSKLAIGWWYGTERYEEAIRFEVDWAEFE
ncbi:MAG: DUF6544 family protein [Chloroflexota bacterium]